MEIEAAKVIGAGLAVIGVIGSGIYRSCWKKSCSKRRSFYYDYVRFRIG